MSRPKSKIMYYHHRGWMFLCNRKCQHQLPWPKIITKEVEYFDAIAWLSPYIVLSFVASRAVWLRNPSHTAKNEIEAYIFCTNLCHRNIDNLCKSPEIHFQGNPLEIDAAMTIWSCHLKWSVKPNLAKSHEKSNNLTSEHHWKYIRHIFWSTKDTYFPHSGIQIAEKPSPNHFTYCCTKFQSSISSPVSSTSFPDSSSLSKFSPGCFLKM